MVKTTVIIDDDLYKKLIDECVRRYGSTRKLSKLINEKIRLAYKYEQILDNEKKVKKVRLRLGRDLSPEEIEKLIEEGWEEFIRWNV